MPCFAEEAGVGGRDTAARKAAVICREIACQGYKGSSGEQPALGHLQGPCAQPGHLRLLIAEQPTHGLWQLRDLSGDEGKQPVF